MPNAYITALTGGLGNQMFQYAVGRALSARHDVPLQLDIRGLAQDPLRRYALAPFHISAALATAAEMPRELGRIGRRLHRLPRWLTGNRRFVEQGFRFDPSVNRLKPPVHLAGNWQSEKYFADQAGLIRAEFQLREPLTADRQAIASDMADRAAVSVHVRRGDYANDPATNAYHGTCEPEWYAQAQQMIEQQVPAPAYLVFSDDPDWARANLPSLANARFVEPSTDGRDEQDMHLMSLCHHHIIANSSFSWWGAWLNPRPDKVVIGPRQWFRSGKHDTRDLLPQDWIRL